MYIAIVYMCIRRLFCMPYANFMGQCDFIVRLMYKEVVYMSLTSGTQLHEMSANTSYPECFLFLEWQAHQLMLQFYNLRGRHVPVFSANS